MNSLISSRLLWVDIRVVASYPKCDPEMVRDAQAFFGATQGIC